MKNICKEKIEIMNKLNEIKGKQDIIYELTEDENIILGDLYRYLTYLFNGLWKKPESVKLIIEKADIDVLKEHLAPFFVHNFYENIFSFNCIEENLLYVFTLLLQSEINNLKDINQLNQFLDDTTAGIMLEELYKKYEIQNYLNNITKDAIENLDKKFSENKISFDPNEINIKIENMNVSNKMKENQNKKEDFNKKYLSNIDELSLKKIIEENKNNINMNDYLNSKLLIINKDKNIFSNEKFLLFCKKY